MQKKLIALAITAAFSAPAFADVSVYGVLDAGYGDTSKTLTAAPGGAAVPGKTGQTAIAFSQASSSRLGFLATEALDGGMTATVKVETGISSNPLAGVVQTGTATPTIPGAGTTANPAGTNGTTLDATTLGSRELNVTLAFGQGTDIKAGYGSTPVRDITFAYDSALGGNLVGNLITNDVGTANNRATSIDVRHQFGPLKATVGFMANTDHTDGRTDTKKGNGYQLAAQYGKDALSIAGAYQSAESNAVAGVAPFAATADVTTKTAIIGASYDLGVAKITAQYANIKTSDAVTATAAGTGTRSMENIGVSAPFGKITAFAQVSAGSQNQIATGATTSSSRNLSGYTVGAKYNLSKTTWAYASFGSTKLNTGTIAAETGIKADQYAIGLVKSF